MKDKIYYRTGGEIVKEQPYLITSRNEKAILLESLMKNTNVQSQEIPWNEKDVFEVMAGLVEFENHPCLSDISDFDLGIWGLPEVGTRWTIQALKEKSVINNFEELVQITQKALSYWTAHDGNIDT